LLLELRIIARELLLASQRLHALFHVAAPPLILTEREEGPQIVIGEPVHLPTKMCLGLAQRLAIGGHSCGG
jgi:hypothetical protein